jgi:hypothetical protein
VSRILRLCDRAQNYWKKFISQYIPSKNRIKFCCRSSPLKAKFIFSIRNTWTPVSTVIFRTENFAGWNRESMWMPVLYVSGMPTLLILTTLFRQKWVTYTRKMSFCSQEPLPVISVTFNNILQKKLLSVSVSISVYNLLKKYCVLQMSVISLHLQEVSAIKNF